MDPADLKLPARKSIPNRDMPSSSATIPEESPDQPHVHFDTSASAPAKAAPAFSEPGFGAPSGQTTGEVKSALAPTAQT